MYLALQIIAAERTSAAFADAHFAHLPLGCLRGDVADGGAHAAHPNGIAWHRRLLEGAAHAMRTKPSGGGVSRGCVLFNAIVAAALTQIHLEVRASHRGSTRRLCDESV